MIIRVRGVRPHSGADLQNLEGVIDPFDAICRECVQEWPSDSHWKSALDANIRPVIEMRTRSRP